MFGIRKTADIVIYPIDCTGEVKQKKNKQNICVIKTSKRNTRCCRMRSTFYVLSVSISRDSTKSSIKTGINTQQHVTDVFSVVVR